MRFGRPGTIDVQDSVRVRSQEIGNHHAMAIEEEPLGAHVRGPRLIGELEQVGDRALELRREHVVGIIAKTIVADRNVRGIIADVFAATAKFFHPAISNAGSRKGFLQRLAIELRQTTRHGKRTDIHEGLNRMGLENFDEFVERAGGMADGIEN